MAIKAGFNSLTTTKVTVVNKISNSLQSKTTTSNVANLGATKSNQIIASV